MKINFDQKVKEGILIADGAMGTMLQKKGLAQGESNEEWNLSHGEKKKEEEEVITDIHRQYIEAGADLIFTNTFYTPGGIYPFSSEIFRGKRNSLYCNFRFFQRRPPQLRYQYIFPKT